MTGLIGPRTQESACGGLPHPRDAPPVEAHQLLSVVFLAALLVAPVVLVLVPLADESGIRGDPLAIALSAAIVVYSAVRLGSFCWRAKPHWANALFWAFSYVWLGLASLAQVASGVNALSTSFAPRTQVVALVVVLLGFLAFDLGRRLPFTTRRRRRDDARCTKAPRGWVLSRRRVVLLGGVTVLLTPALALALGGSTALFGSRQAIADQLVAGAFFTATSHVFGGLLLAAANVLPFATALAAVCLLRARARGRRDVVLIVLVGALALSNLLLNNPISNARNWFLTVAIAFVLALGLLRRPVAKIAFLALFLAGATVVFPYADAFRNEQSGIHNSIRSTSTPVDYLIGKTDYGAVTDVAATALHVEREGHTWGRQLLGAAAFWVPRSVWTDKPVNTAEILAEEIDFPNPNLDTPLWAEGYIDFGLLGTALLLGTFGVLSRRADDVLERADLRPDRCADVVFPIAISFVGYESFLLRGSLLQAMARIVTVIVVFLVLATRVRPEPDASAPARGPG